MELSTNFEIKFESIVVVVVINTVCSLHVYIKTQYVHCMFISKHCMFTACLYQNNNPRCLHHNGKLRTRKSRGFKGEMERSRIYDCCDAQDGSTGCSVGKGHVYDIAFLHRDWRGELPQIFLVISN